MTLQRNLLTSKGSIIDISSDDKRIVEHFANKSSYADVVLNMFNNDRFYDQFFNGWEDLTVLDIGANIGLFSLYIQDRAKVVYALEPTPVHFDILCEMTKNYSNIKPLRIALHNKDESVDFFISDENSTMNSTVNQYGKKIPVPGITLPSLLTSLNLDMVDFVKCDIEGSEMMAISDEILDSVRSKIKVWSLEVHATNAYPTHEISLHQNRDKLAHMFANHGYKTYVHRYDCLYAYRP